MRGNESAFPQQKLRKDFTGREEIDMANRLRELRESRHRTQEEVAKDLNISQQSLSRYEKDGSTMNIEMAARLADYYTVSIDYLVGRSEQKRFSGEDAYLQLDEDKYALLECYDTLETEWKKIVWAIVGRVSRDRREPVYRHLD